jgi:hypothetical protein
MKDQCAAVLLFLSVLGIAGCGRTEKKAEAASAKPAEAISVQTVAAESRLLERT